MAPRAWLTWGSGVSVLHTALLAAGACCGCAGTTKQSVLGHPMRQRINLVVLR